MPRTIPGTVPGTVPGTIPGTVPRTIPGTVPGTVPRTIPGTAPLVAVALAAALITGVSVSAHRADELLQAARIAVEPDRVELELDLTPGIALADTIGADVDRDRDGSLSAGEQHAYVGRVMSALDLTLDTRPVRLELVASSFPEPDAFRRGDGTIRLEASAGVPALTPGDHRLVFRNRYQPNLSAYLANALVPRSDRIAVAAQRRDPEQRSLTIDYVVGARRTTASMAWYVRRCLEGPVPGGSKTTRLMLLCLLLFFSATANARAADVTGRWKVTISLGGETMTGVALLQQTGDKVTGSIGQDERNQHPLDGVVDGNRVTLTTHPRPGRTVAFDRCDLTVDGDKMTGTTEGGDLRDKATIEFARMKE